MRIYTFAQGENSYTFQTHKPEDIPIAFETLKVIWYLCNVALNLTEKCQQEKIEELNFF